jgi:hypothetical protein
LIRRIAIGYAWLLFSLEAMLLFFTLLLHVGVLLGFEDPYRKMQNALYIAMLTLFVPIAAFVGESWKWLQQVKTCPDWMWKLALILAGYGIFAFCLQMFLFANGPNPQDQTLATSGFILGFEAISACIMFSSLRTEKIEISEFMRRSRNSVLFIAACLLFLIVRHVIPTS